MRVGLIDIEPKIFNTAYMQIAYWHRQQGDTVEWAAPLEYDKYDKLYCSSIFTFTDKSAVPKQAICGGTGFDLTTKLAFDCDLDYSIYPKCKTSYFWFSRGCPRNCPFCVVRQKEGNIHAVPLKNQNRNSDYDTIMDNNFFANKDWRHAYSYLMKLPERPVDFQGIDVRDMNDEKFKKLDNFKHYKQIKIAWDDPKDEYMRGHLEFMTRFIKPYKIMCYVLIGYDSTEQEDLMRIEIIKDFGMDPFVMPYDKSNPYQKKFARWCNRQAICQSVKWEDYK